MSDTGQSLDLEAPDDELVLEDDRSQLRDLSDEASSRVSFVELFYDLVFVFAVTQLAAYLVDNITPEGAVRAGVLFVAVWWLWINTTWATNRLDPDAAPVRFAMFALMGASLVLSMALPRGCCHTDANSSQIRQVRRMSVGAERPPLSESGGAGLLVSVSAG
jgi:hypothetical protein